MHGIIYFPEDHTLCTIKKSHRDLSTTSFEAGSRCVMKWGSKHFDGTILKTGEKEVELKKLADKLVVVLKELGKGEDAVGALLNEINRLECSQTNRKTTKSGSHTMPKSSNPTKAATTTTKTSLLETWKMINAEYTDSPIVVTSQADIQLPSTQMHSISPFVTQSPSVMQSQSFTQSPSVMQSPPVTQSQSFTQSHSVMQSTPVTQSQSFTQSPSVMQFPFVTQSPSVMQSPFVTQSQSFTHGPSVMQSTPVTQSQSFTQSSSVMQFPFVTQSQSFTQSPSVMQSPFVTQSHSFTQSPPVMQAPPVMHLPPVTQSPFVMQSPSDLQSPSVMQSPSDLQSPSVIQSPSVMQSSTTFPSPSFTQLLSPSAIQKQSTPLYNQLQTCHEPSSCIQPPSTGQSEQNSSFIDLDASSSHMQALNNMQTPFIQPHSSYASSSNIPFDPTINTPITHPQSTPQQQILDRRNDNTSISPGLRHVLSQLVDPQIQQEIKALLGSAENEREPQKLAIAVKRNTKTRLFPVTPQQIPCDSAEAAANTEAEDDNYQLRCSPRKKSCTVQKSDDQCQKMVKLLDKNPTVIESFRLRKATSAALKNFNPGFCLMGKLLPEVISRVDLARSKGQGIGASSTKDDLRSTLDPVKVAACKGYVRMWCKEHNKPEPDDTQMNRAITQQIDYSRKLLKTKN